jgi:hypothetical protein
MLAFSGDMDDEAPELTPELLASLPGFFEEFNRGPSFPLFRYFAPERIDVVEKERIAFVHPTAFNDPFDTAPIVNARATKLDVKHKIAERMRVSPYCVTEFNSEQVDGINKLSRKERRALFRDERKKAIGRYLEFNHKMAESAQELYQKNFGSAVLCLTAKKDNLLMWAHYAASHSGFVIEFDLDVKTFRRLGILWKMMYVDNRPVLDYMDRTRNEFVSNIQGWFSKGTSWAYEEEYRFLRHDKLCEKVLLPNGRAIYFVDLPKECIKSIYLGCRCNEELIRRARAATEGTSIALHHARPSRTSYVLEFAPLKNQSLEEKARLL